MVDTVKHATMAGIDMHALTRWNVSDLAARDALVPAAADLHKLCYVQSTGDYYILNAVDPGVVWKRLSYDTSNPIVGVALAAQTLTFTFEDGATTGIAFPNSVVDVQYDAPSNALVFTYWDDSTASLGLTDQYAGNAIEDVAQDAETGDLTFTYRDASTKVVTAGGGGGGFETGHVALFPLGGTPTGWQPLDGRSLSVANNSEYADLFAGHTISDTVGRRWGDGGLLGGTNVQRNLTMPDNGFRSVGYVVYNNSTQVAIQVTPDTNGGSDYQPDGIDGTQSAWSILSSVVLGTDTYFGRDDGTTGVIDTIDFDGVETTRVVADFSALDASFNKNFRLVGAVTGYLIAVASTSGVAKVVRINVSDWTAQVLTSIPDTTTQSYTDLETNSCVVGDTLYVRVDENGPIYQVDPINDTASTLTASPQSAYNFVVDTTETYVLQQEHASDVDKVYRLSDGVELASIPRVYEISNFNKLYSFNGLIVIAHDCPAGDTATFATIIDPEKGVKLALPALPSGAEVFGSLDVAYSDDLAEFLFDMNMSVSPDSDDRTLFGMAHEYQTNSFNMPNPTAPDPSMAYSIFGPDYA